MHDELSHFVHPLGSYTSGAALRLAGFEKEFLEGQYPDGADGPMYEYEVIRHHSTTVDGQVESPKLPGGSGYSNFDFTDWGADKEAYRWTTLHANRRDRDEYDRIIAVEQLFALPAATFAQNAGDLIDLDQWSRLLAFQSLTGPNDVIYTGSNIHNFRMYVRSDDQRAVYLPWDWDSAFSRSTTASLFGGGNIAKVATATPDLRRTYLSHMYDLCESVVNTGYMSYWANHYGSVANENFSGILNYIGNRSAFVHGQLPTGTAFTAAASTPDTNGASVLSGTANIAVHEVVVNGVAYVPQWSSDTAWSITVPLDLGTNSLSVVGIDRAGDAVSGATDTLTVVNTHVSEWPALRINEWLADGPGADWFELFNPTNVAVDLEGWTLSDDSAVPFQAAIPSGWVIPASGFLVVQADNQLALSPVTTNDLLHVPFALSASGESILLSAPDSREIDRVDFLAQEKEVSEGRFRDGMSAIFRLGAPTPGGPNLLQPQLNSERTGGNIRVSFTSTPGWTYQLYRSTDLIAWEPTLDSVVATGEAINFIFPAPVGNRYYYHVRLTP
jgi:hypothetical protein